MKNKLLFLALLPLALFAQTTGKINAEITVGANIVQQNQMNFAKIVANGTASVTMSPQGVRSTTGNATVSGDGFGANTFYIQGATNSTFVLELPESCTLTNGKSIINANGFTSTLSNNRGTTDLKGFVAFGVGCTIELTSGTTSGIYSGTYLLTAVYQ